MKLGSRRVILGALETAVAGLLGVALAGGQAKPAEKPLLAEDVHKNVQVLRGIPENQFMETMGFFSAALSANCTFCHVPESSGDWQRYADETPLKQTTRMMVMMMSAINKEYFGGRRMVTCYSCHHGDEIPGVTPSIAEVYGPPRLEDPDEISEQAPGAPPADQILDKYLQALGGAERLSHVTSFVAKGTYQGFADDVKRPAEVFSQAPGERTTIVHAPSGDSTTTCDGKSAWVAAPETDQPVPVMPLVGTDLDAARLDAELAFPAHIKQSFSQWRVGFPATIDDREVQVVQGTSAGRSPVKFYFDKQSGLLVRQVRYTDSPVGLNPTQVDYADYREVSGVKMPFRWTVTWLDGRSTTELSEAQANVPIDPAKFAKPAAPPPPPKADSGKRGQ